MERFSRFGCNNRRFLMACARLILRGTAGNSGDFGSVFRTTSALSAKRKHSENCTFYDSLNFDAPHRANARTHAQAETANRLLSLCSIGSGKENHPKMLKLKTRFVSGGEIIMESCNNLACVLAFRTYCPHSCSFGRQPQPRTCDFYSSLRGPPYRRPK